ncbi:MAG TPA: HAMP domain-containing sensor histidine kinase [Polyangiaceae bacterium LLY-WYZ-15_(1-7)]|nr:two-component sensor histidine kinase [Sandaracinus sp.]MBJ73132.1 two-component sensor histidine kinase [Sandaracinus sp.]HJL05142.1 HAMP domain-containing sensor histidine kinase [Polyangiaceae bacterium LLY-WYZ-15_(1-7)]HJL12993.1 HAMP domain-containing sensor histidine kinase [Polyangiaceae bacterium LLY-WYZ-15_(1-7)]HJL50583.1 HAMP domain-containing sensor histidine kinase [Polyangiaceae bacterium LLY-WYZ-15_(1-7)]
MARRLGFGLRLQLVLALSAAFIIAFALLGVAAVQLGRRARESARVRDAEAAARVIAAGLAEGPNHARFVSLADAALGHGGIRGAEWERPRVQTWVRGVTGLGTPVEVPVEVRAPGGVGADTTRHGVVRLWVRPGDARAEAGFGNLMLFYVAFTGGAILLLTYLALTFLIVRPVEAVTRASERVAEGRLETQVPVRGAAEVAGLAQSFNAMARQLGAERLALEERLRQLEAARAETSAAQDQVLRSARLASVGRLAAGIAHEIGNPLAAILGLTEIARDADLDAEERDEFLARIQTETERIHRIIRDLLDFARQEQEPGAGDGERRADLGQVVADAVHLVAPQKDTAKLRIERRVEEVPPVRGSADRLTQVVLNLLLNAADAVEGEGDVVVEVAREGEEVVLSVSDTGPGIPEDVLEELFEPFVTTKPVGQGTGLGLAVCHTIVERVGGTITAENAEGGGARFVIRLPLA